jgi:hypothetical protein
MKNYFEVRGDTTAIVLNRKNGPNLETLIDTVDLEKANQFPNTWCASWSGITNSFYCYGKLTLPNGKRVSILLHRWLMECPDDLHVDHINNDTLNNRRLENLRLVLHKENHQNRLGPQRNSLLGIRGVCWHKGKKKWQAAINVNGLRKCVGYYSTIKDAEDAVKHARGVFMPFSKEAHFK